MKKNPRKIYVSKIKLLIILIFEEVSFSELQKALFKGYILIHFDNDKIL